MRYRRETVNGLLFLAALTLLVLTGCRAFQPEAVIVNKAPETFIVGAPMEDSGGYYRFHVHWYGSDMDGRVESFVWALTDTTIQDEDTTDDEEDLRFNPALDASTLAIGHWTTKTDSIFLFRIDQGVQFSYDMTLHIVAVDNLGDFDRTPARLHFFSNTLGNPTINFFQVVNGDSMIAVPSGQADTVGFARPYHVRWEGETPNIRGFTAEALALVDTVPDFRGLLETGETVPMGDGLLGFKYKLLGELGGNCVPSLMDCWSPRDFDEATGDSFSVFVKYDEFGNMLPPIQELIFKNENLSDNPFEKILPSGAVNMEVNSIDIAGVEVDYFNRPFAFVVNFDPETIVLDNQTDWAHPEDTETYPYYILLNDSTQTHYPFESGERIPDRTYVVVKALARDNPKDNRLDPNFKIGISGYLHGLRHSYAGGQFSITSESSALNFNPTWDATCDTCWYADTLGFLTGPRHTFTINMQSTDEHGRRDGSPAQLSFDVGWPPCIQCVEILPKSIPSQLVEEPVCVECETDPCDENADIANIAPHSCFGDTTVLRVTTDGLGVDELQIIQDAYMLVDKASGYTRVVLEPGQGGDTNYQIDAYLYRMDILLHGLDVKEERWKEVERRIMSWAYQIDYVCDPFNQIKDGGGNDNLLDITWGKTVGREGLEVDLATGLWRLSVDVAVPQYLVDYGPNIYKETYLQYNVGITDPEIRERVLNDTTKQFGLGMVRAIALDQTRCNFAPARPARYNFFRYVRPSVAELPTGYSWRDCGLRTSGLPGMHEIQADMDISASAMSSLNNKPVAQYFRIIIETGLEGDFECSAPAWF